VKSAIEGLKPEAIWEHFYAISQIPRESGNEEAVGEYIISVAEKNGLKYKKDKVGNLVVYAPPSGRDDRPAVVIQGHTDMVGEKNSGTEHDFTKDPIRLVRDGEWIHADGTTLGADNGIGVVCALAIMEDKTIERPAMEFLFTVDEETGLTGASALEAGLIDSRILINLDSEEEGAFYIGCAGGQHTILRRTAKYDARPAGEKTLKIGLSGLRGGHSGLSIHEGLGNSIKLLSRLLYDLNLVAPYRLVSITGGNKHNAIPREAEAKITVGDENISAVNDFIVEVNKTFKNELQFTDKGVALKTEVVEDADQVMDMNLQDDLINLLHAMPHGVMAMSHAVENLVETSTNMAVVELKNGTIELLTSQRSSVGSAIKDIASKVKSLGELAKFEVEQGGGYPAWEPNPNSDILKTSVKTYESMYGSKPEVKAIHAGLECGIIAEKYPGMDMISFGPTIEGAHSPDERVHIKAVENCWNFLLALLKSV
jgi:dipeptidase D